MANKTTKCINQKLIKFREVLTLLMYCRMTYENIGY